MQLVLGKYNEQAAPHLIKDQACMELFIEALGTVSKPYPDIPCFQIIVLLQEGQDTSQAVPEEGAVSRERVTLILELLQHKKKLQRPQMLVPALQPPLVPGDVNRGARQPRVRPSM